MAAKPRKETTAKARVATKAKPKATTTEKKGQASVTAKARSLARKRAKELDIPVEKLSLTDMIRAIQRAEGNFDCFATASAYCDQDNCCWRFACLIAT